VWTLVRPRNKVGAHCRVSRRLQLGFPSTDTAALRKVIPASGDMRRPDLGLCRKLSAKIRKSIDLIIHCASVTHFNNPGECNEVNIDGMLNLISFSQNCSRAPLVIYMSTSFVCGLQLNRALKEQNVPGAELHHNEYTRSKATAERCLIESKLSHLRLRPSIVLSAGLRSREFARAILWCVPILHFIGGAPIEAQSRIDIVPVRFVVDSVRKLLATKRLSHSCYHISCGVEQSVSVDAIIKCSAKLYESRRVLRLVNPTQWISRIEKQYVRSHHHRRLMNMLQHYLPFINMNVVFDNGRLRAACGREWRPPLPVTAYLADLLRQLDLEEAISESQHP
jgi:nucleoside-diphosphate-sugar epimerase